MQTNEELGEDGAIVIDLLEAQEELCADNTSKYLVYKGGFGAGKTSGACAKTIALILANPHVDGLAVAPTYRLLMDGYVATMIKLCALWGIGCEWLDSKKALRISIGAVRRLVHCRSADSKAGIIAITVGWVIIDEWEKCSLQAVKDAFSRVRDPAAYMRQRVLIGTPEGFGWGYTFAEEKPPPGLRIIAAPTSANTFLDPSYEQDLRAVLSESEAREKLDGVRTKGEGVVYTRFDRAVHCVEPWAALPSESRLEIWADFNVAAMAWCFAWVDETRGTAHVFEELVGKNTEVMEQAERAMIRAGEIMSEKMGFAFSNIDTRRAGIRIICDASAKNRSVSSSATVVSLLNQAGLRAIYGSANPLVEDRVLTVQNALAKRKVTIDPKGAPYFVRCIESQPYDSSGRPSKDPGQGLDHGADALGYGICTHWPVWRTPASEYASRAHVAAPDRIHAV